MTLNFKNSNFEVKKVGKNGVFQGYASVFDIEDNGNDIVKPGAFKKSLKERNAAKVAQLWQHRDSEPIGLWNTIKEDKKGLFVKGTLNLEFIYARKALFILQNYGGLSIGYKAVDWHYQDNNDSYWPTRVLNELKLYEISIVTFPMNEDSTASSVKSSQQNCSMLEVQMAALSLSLSL